VSSVARYLRFVALASAVALAAALLGVLPTRWLAGEPAVPALFAGCFVSWAASVLGGIPIALAEAAEHGSGAGSALRFKAVRFKAVIASMALRFALELVLIVAIAWSGRFDRGPFLIWAALSYLALLAADTKYALGPRRLAGPAS
jgi:hypothetical protein